MPQRKTVLQHISNTIADELKAQFPGLTVVFVISEPAGYKKALEFKSHEILKHPAGKSLLDAIEGIKPSRPELVTFIGIAGPTAFKNPFKKAKTIACLYINPELYNDDKDAKTALYSRVFIILKTHTYLTDKNRKANEDNTVTLKTLNLSPEFQNMLGDVFTSVYFDLSGRTGSPQSLAKKRCQELFEQRIKHYPENNPFPLVLDVTKIVLEEMRSVIKNKSPAFENALNITEEIELTCDENLNRQWREFTAPTLEMVWNNAEAKEILGAAAFSSESVFNRSTAYLIAEILNIEPSPAYGSVEYNLFRDHETLERLHFKVSDEKFLKLLHGGNEFKHARLLTAANKQTVELLEGKPIGWSAPALIEAYLQADKQSESIVRADIASQTFYKEIKNLSWAGLNAMVRNLNIMKREGKTPDLRAIMEFLRQNEDTRAAALSIKKLIDINEDE